MVQKTENIMSKQFFVENVCAGDTLGFGKGNFYLTFEPQAREITCC